MNDIYFLDLGLVNPDTSAEDAAAFLMANRGRESVFDGYMLVKIGSRVFLVEKEKLMDFVSELDSERGLTLYGSKRQRS